MIPPIFVLGAVFGPAGLIFQEFSLSTTMLMFLPMAMAVHYSVHVLQELTTNPTQIDNNQKVRIEPITMQARAITGTTVLMSLGWFPLLFFPLIPLPRAGILGGAIAFVAGPACLCIVPALLTRVKKWLLKNQEPASDQDS